MGTLLAGALMVGEILRQGRRPWEGESLTLSLRPALPRPHIHDRWGTLEGSVGGRAVRLPVSLVRERGSEGLREVFCTFVGGWILQAPNPQRLRTAVEEIATGMSHAGQLPLYAFCLPGAGREIFAFVYRLGTWRALIGDGSILEAATLPILRERLAAAWGESPKALGVLRLSERLAWVPPVASFQDLEARRWLPLFEAEGGLIGPWDLTEQPFPAPEEGLLAVLVGRIPEGGVFQGLDPTWTLRLAAGLIPAGESLRCFSRDGGRLVPRDLPVFRDPGGSAWIAWATAGGAEAAAWREYNEAAMAQMVVEILPALARALAEPLARTERIILIGDGHGAGVSRLTGDLAQALAQLPAVVEALTGVRWPTALHPVPQPSRNPEEA